MRQSHLISTLVQLLPLVYGAPVIRPNKDNSSNDTPDGVLQFDVNHVIQPIDFSSQQLVHRRSLENTSLALANQISFYTIDFRLGTPFQNASAVLDTGSSDLWLYDKVTGRSPYFDSSASSSYHYLDDHLFISYGSGPVMGNWGTETIEFAKYPLRNATFGLVTRDRLVGSKIPGIMGVGKIQNEAAATIYQNIPALLQREGVIKKNAYSIALNALTNPKGSCIFGGVDSSKYTGPLWSLPAAKNAHLAVQLSGIHLVNNTSAGPVPTGADGSKVPNGSVPLPNSASAQALLDTGTSFMYLPDAVVDAVVASLGAVYYAQYGIYFVPTFNESSSPSLVFNFSGAQIEIPAHEYIVPAPLFTPDNTPTPYILSIFKSSLVHGYVILGDTFIRSSYVVFDLTDNVIALAQANHAPETGSAPASGAGSSSVQPIVNSIPGAIPAPQLLKM